MIYNLFHQQLNNRIHISLYWKCQLIGWSVAALYWEYHGYVFSSHFDWLQAVLQFTGDVVILILLTHAYRTFALKHSFKNLNIGQLLQRIIPAALILGGAYTFATTMKLHLFQVWFSRYPVQTYTAFFKSNAETIFIGGMRLMSIWLLAYHMYHYAQREIRMSRENARLALITREAQLNNLSAQLNPHFLFNSLNNIKALVSDNPRIARRAIDLLSDLLRTSLYNGDQTLITIKDELAIVNDYLELEKLRFEERLQYEIYIEENLANAQIPRLSIHLLVENAIKHGIAQKKNGGLVVVRVERLPAGIKITVQNPGRVANFDKDNGLGLNNLRERLALEYKGRAEFILSGQLHDIVLATINLPLA